ncbi:Hypothetical predicted protein [Scomber scombrus]|uniref:Uncharacterized protein n=1 Tax=Scomber scombrus TaxID=13677 RepID=A0AAV1Q3W7_SCOSC
METVSLLPADIICCCAVAEQAHEYLRFMDTDRRVTQKTAASLSGPPPPPPMEIQRSLKGEREEGLEGMDGEKEGSQKETDRPPFYLGQRQSGYLGY